MAKSGTLVGVHFNKFTGGPGRVEIRDGQLFVTPRRGEPFSYSGLITVIRKREEPFFVNHWMELTLPAGPMWLTCSKKRALALTESLREAGLTVEWK